MQTVLTSVLATQDIIPAVAIRIAVLAATKMKIVILLMDGMTLEHFLVMATVKDVNRKNIETIAALLADVLLL
jgi:hypothetical protein